MQNLKLKYGDLLIIDPCYIKEVSDGVDNRYDALKCVKVLLEGDDGEYTVCINDKDYFDLGVDSGRIWVLECEFDCEAKIDAGLSGFKHCTKGETSPEMIKIVEYEYE